MTWTRAYRRAFTTCGPGDDNFMKLLVELRKHTYNSYLWQRLQHQMYFLVWLIVKKIWKSKPSFEDALLLFKSLRKASPLLNKKPLFLTCYIRRMPVSQRASPASPSVRVFATLWIPLGSWANLVGLGFVFLEGVMGLGLWEILSNLITEGLHMQGVGGGAIRKWKARWIVLW